MDTVAIEITTDNAHLFEIELNYILNVQDYKECPQFWNTYYLVVDQDGPFLLEPPLFDQKYQFMTPIRNDRMQLVREI